MSRWVSNTNQKKFFSLSTVQAVAAGWTHTMILKEGGTLWAIGYDEYGQLGLGDEEDRSTPELVKF